MKSLRGDPSSKLVPATEGDKGAHTGKNPISRLFSLSFWTDGPGTLIHIHHAVPLRILFQYIQGRTYFFKSHIE